MVSMVYVFRCVCAIEFLLFFQVLTPSKDEKIQSFCLHAHVIDSERSCNYYDIRNRNKAMDHVGFAKNTTYPRDMS